MAVKRFYNFFVMLIWPFLMQIEADFQMMLNNLDFLIENVFYRYMIL